MDEIDAAYCSLTPDRNQFQITSCNSGQSLNIHTVTLSQKSDAFLGSSYSYAGFIIYQYHGRSNWITQNGTRCECGYLAIQRTDSEKIKRLQSGTPGVVHGAVYKSVFGEDIDRSKVIGEGFSIQNGSFKVNSGVFNNPASSEYHDSRKQMSEITMCCIGKVVRSWKQAGPGSIGCTNFPVKHLLS